MPVIFMGSLFMNHPYVYAIEDKVADSILRPQIEYKPEELRDPFWPPPQQMEPPEQIPQVEAKVEPLPTLVIQGVVWGGFAPQAIINNKVVKVGDVIEGVHIIDINKDGITVFFDNREYNLSSPAVVNLQSSKKIEGGKQ